MRVVFMGTPDFAAASLRGLLENSFDVAAVFSQPDKPVGRKQILQPPPVKALALERGIPVYQPTKLRDGTAAELIRSLRPDIIAVVAYGRILPVDILTIPPLGCVNIHGSILPKYRGSAPIQWSVINGDRETGVTAMYMAQGMDTGDIIDIARTPILPGETAGELFERLAPLGADLLVRTLRSLENGTASRTPQNEAEATLAPPLTKELAELDLTQPGEALVHKILGLDPWPVATADIKGTRFKIYKAFSTKKKISAAPGTILSAGKAGIELACGDGSLTVTQLQAPGGKRMAAADYLRGHPLCP